MVVLIEDERLSLWRRFRCVLASVIGSLIGVLGLLLAPLMVQAQVRLLDDADVVETPAHYDLMIRFACDARYITHTPAGEGETLRVRLALGSGCIQGVGAAESLPSPAPAVVRSIDLSPLLANEVELLIHWRLKQKFVVMPSNDRQGMRIRILREGEAGATNSRIFVGEPLQADVTTAYAVNLDSATTVFDPGVVQQAQATLQVPAYVSQADIGGVHWYRLRVGPVATRADAEKLLLLAQRSYPHAWLAIADEQVDESTIQNEAPGPEQELTDADEPQITDAEADALWSSGNERFRKKDYAAAIVQFTKLISRSNGKYRAAAQELLGIAHERRGELALAQADYEAFLRNFPQDKRAARVRRRMNALRTASLPGRTLGAADDNAEGIWHWNAALSQYYRRDHNQVKVDDNSQTTVGQNALLSDVDLTARYRGLNADTRIRISAGYNKSFLKQEVTSFSSSSGDQAHVSSAFVEWADRDRAWYASAGRQSRAGSGTYGTFDGVLGSYQWHPHFTTDLTVGSPVDNARSGINTRRLFQAVAFNFGIFANSIEPSVYVTRQTLEGKVDRQAVGAELRYFRAGTVLIGFVDYDTNYQQLNSAVLIGTFQLPARWTLNVDAEKRKSPLLTTRNALIGQPVQTLDALSSAFSDEEIRQLALDRTPDTSVYSITTSRPLGERLQLTLTAQSMKTGATPASDGSLLDPAYLPIEGTVVDGPQYFYSVQLLAASIMRAGDVNIIGLRRQSGGQVTGTALGFSSRIPVWGDWRIGPQLQVDRRTFVSDGSELTLYAPSLRLSLQRPRLQVDVEAGSEISKRKTDTTDQRTNRWFAYLGYRWMF